MRFLPRYSFTVRTAEPVGVVRERLLAHVSQEDREYSSFATFFRGGVWSGGFRVTRIIGYKNGFIPALVGRFESGADGTHIHVQVRLATWSVAFLCGWSTLVGAGLLLVLLDAFRGEIPWLWVLHALGMLLFGWLLVIGGFWLEAPTSQEQLAQVLSLASTERSGRSD
jgi:hypothetical protein